MGYITAKVDLRELTNLSVKMAVEAKRAEHAVAVQAARDTNDYVPASGAPAGLYNRTQVVDNLIIYPGPYARYLYYGKVMVDSKTGKGPMHYTDKKRNEVIRFRKGAVLKPTQRDLQFTKAFHKNAQAFWFEASKRQNLEKWKRVAAMAVTHYDE